MGVYFVCGDMLYIYTYLVTTARGLLEWSTLSGKTKHTHIYTIILKQGGKEKNTGTFLIILFKSKLINRNKVKVQNIHI